MWFLETFIISSFFISCFLVVQVRPWNKLPRFESELHMLTVSLQPVISLNLIDLICRQGKLIAFTTGRIVLVKWVHTCHIVFVQYLVFGKIYTPAGRNINNLRYADDTTLMAESEEELKSLLMKVKREWKSWLKAQHSENEDHGIWSHHFMADR